MTHLETVVPAHFWTVKQHEMTDTNKATHNDNQEWYKKDKLLSTTWTNQQN